jgi:hypothetical protein
MPNHIHNTLTIEAPKTVLDELLRLIIVDSENGPWFDFDQIFPYPKRFADLDNKANEWDKMYEKACEDGSCPDVEENGTVSLARHKWFDEHPRMQDGFNSGGQNWRIVTWGTKWNSYETKVTKPKRKQRESDVFVAKIRFKTAWEAPIPIIYGLAAIFPQARYHLSYNVEGHKSTKRSLDVEGPSRQEFTGSVYPQNALFKCSRVECTLRALR